MELKSDLRVDQYLEHYGVLGMKWGRRKADKAPNPEYSSNQRKRDRQVYGGRGEARINKALNRGDSISVARGNEKTKRDKVMNANKYVRQGGKVAGAVGGVAAANVAISGLSSVGNSLLVNGLVSKAFGSQASRIMRIGVNSLDSSFGRIAISTGAAKVGYMLAGDSAVALNMRFHGYNPNRR